MNDNDIAYHIEQTIWHAHQARIAIAARKPGHDSPMHHAQIHIAGAEGAAGRAKEKWGRVVREGVKP